MLFSKIFKDSKPKITVIYRFEKSKDHFAPGVLLYVENGKGDLRESFVDGRYSLNFRNRPLLELHGDEYFCPTCEKIVKTAYNLEQTDEFHMNKINRQGVSFDEILDEMIPLLGLLKSGYYCLWDTKLYPTDGNGNLFWDYPNEDKELPGSCVFYFGDGEWGKSIPHYMIATQPKCKLNPERIEYYRNNPGCRAIAYYMDGNITALIDGHHKAMASAMEHTECNTIVIASCYKGYRVSKRGRHYDFLQAGDCTFDVNELGIRLIDEVGSNQTSSSEHEKIYTMEVSVDDKFPCDIDTKSLADYYPTVDQCIGIDIMGGDIDENVSGFLNGNKSFDLTDLEVLLAALTGMKHDKIFEVADKVLSNCWDAATMLMALRYMLKLSHTDELEKYLIDYMVEVEGEHPEVGRYIMQNLW